MLKLLSVFMSVAAAEEVATAVETSLFTGMSLFQKGLVVTVAGLLGVFLVLCLFFITIKVMQKFGK